MTLRMAQRNNRDNKHRDSQHCYGDAAHAVPHRPLRIMAGHPTLLAQTSIPSRRADRCRCRLARNRRSLFTSIGSAAMAAGVSISALRTW